MARRGRLGGRGRRGLAVAIDAALAAVGHGGRLGRTIEAALGLMGGGVALVAYMRARCARVERRRWPRLRRWLRRLWKGEG